MSSKGILAHYSPEDVQITLAGLFTLEGFKEGSFIKITRDSPLFTTRESSDGRVSRVKKPSRTYTVTVTLMSTASSNEVLTRLALLDHSTGVAKLSLMIKDSLGTSLFFSASAWVSEMPDMEFSTGVTDRQWVFSCTQSSFHVGGNEEGSGVAEDAINILTGLSPSLSRFF